ERERRDDRPDLLSVRAPDGPRVDQGVRALLLLVAVRAAVQLLRQVLDRLGPGRGLERAVACEDPDAGAGVLRRRSLNEADFAIPADGDGLERGFGALSCDAIGCRVEAPAQEQVEPERHAPDHEGRADGNRQPQPRPQASDLHSRAYPTPWTVRIVLSV